MRMEWVACAWNGLRADGMGCNHGMGCVCMEWVSCAWNGLRVHGMEYICAGHYIFVYIILSALECHTKFMSEFVLRNVLNGAVSLSRVLKLLVAVTTSSRWRGRSGEG